MKPILVCSVLFLCVGAGGSKRANSASECRCKCVKNRFTVLKKTIWFTGYSRWRVSRLIYTAGRRRAGRKYSASIPSRKRYFGRTARRRGSEPVCMAGTAVLGPRRAFRQPRIFGAKGGKDWATAANASERGARAVLEANRRIVSHFSFFRTRRRVSSQIL